MRFRLSRLTLACSALLALGACGGGSSTAATTTVVATDTTCKPSTTTFEPGSHTFELKNDGSKESELYVYGPNDKIVGEVEHVGPGTSRRVVVDLTTGDFQLACKADGASGGVRVPILVRGKTSP